MPTLWRHHAVYGQSLAIGTASTGYFPATPEYPDNTGHPTGSGFVDMDYLAGADISVPRTRPKHSIAARMFEQYAAGTQPGDTDAFISAEQAGASGFTYAQLAQGTAQYTTLMTRTGWFVTDAGAVDAEIEAFHWIHGTANSDTARATYLGHLQEIQSDFDTDAKALTSQTTDIPMTMSQHWSRSSTVTGAGPQLAALDAYRNDPDLFLLAGPRYHLQRNEASLPHLTGLGYYMLGEYHARSLKPLFKPVAPVWITLEGAVIIATFSTTSQLAFDTTLVTANVDYGFQYTDDGTPPAITDISIIGTNKVAITLATTPSGANPTLSYGLYNSADGNNTTDGWRGNLRDSNTEVSGFDDSTPLYNWCCQFEDPIPFGSPIDVGRSNDTGLQPSAIAGQGAGNVLQGVVST